MHWDRITKTWMRLVSKTVAFRVSAPQIDAERGGPTHGAAPVDDVQEESQTQPYIPANNARLSESSLHFSC